jgi:hypothetical protein
MDLDKEVFKGKKISDLAKEAYETHKEKSSMIQMEIDRLSNMISTPGEAIVLVPEIKNLIDTSLKNDEVIIKLLQTFQKVASIEAASKEDPNAGLSQRDIEQLFSEVSEYTVSSKKENQKQLPDKQ